ncbi:Phosphoglycolate phosphatase [Spironucleus salmonicida]|uniref:Phosphoglycolate phosphatase n=1 Tax=Spironucleus salmonicida TaxID=348837 RepID=A0A9P8RZM5_9EUKA|nr:Phosphoglycolate phosphatase [Spironucleus salmonicida]KAH0575147.1 Phosphoglycolate phosphatase [Spironucleus salmonicida]
MQTIFFDLDGTLVDSLASIATALNASRLVFGLDPLPDAEVCRCVGWGAKALVERTAPAAVQEQLLAHYLAELHAATPALFPGVVELLDALRAAGRNRLVVASNKPEDTLQQLVVKLGLAQYFDEVRGVGAFQPKPNPAILACEQRAVLVGDSEVDVQTAIAAGIPVVAVTYGFRTRAELVGATIIVDSVAEIREAVERLLGEEE